MMKKLENGKKIIQVQHINSSSAYDYVAGEGTEDNNKSKWANAVVTVDGIDSYFVWIPRYAYKITYNDVNDKSAGGTIDVKFLVGTSDNYYDENGELKKAQRAVTGKEDTTSDYYVHPAFTNNVDLGGWDSELTGIWVGKYETSLVDTTDKNNITNVVTDDEGSGNMLLSNVENRAIAVQPGMSSWRYCTIGNMYTNAKSYAENLNSHMLKNSEWGAVAYLTHSQYGRNGHEVELNDNDGYITADEGIDVNIKQSTTGNLYGIYDLSGGATEFTAIYFNATTSDYLVNNANSFARFEGESDKYATAYIEEEQKLGFLLGDATYETGKWNNDVYGFYNSKLPFLARGGVWGDGQERGGIFVCYGYNGTADGAYSSHLCLGIK